MQRRPIAAPRLNGSFYSVVLGTVDRASADGTWSSGPDELFIRAGMPPGAHDPDSRYPMASVQRLWALPTESSQDPCFGLDVAQLRHPTTFHAIGYTALARRAIFKKCEGWPRARRGDPRAPPVGVRMVPSRSVWAQPCSVSAHVCLRKLKLAHH